MVTSAETVLVTPPISTEAVMVYVADGVIVVGVPEIVPVAGSKLSPAGSCPLIVNVDDVPSSLRTELVIAVIATPTASVVEVSEVVSPGFVTKVDVVIVGPDPAAFTAATTAVY